MNIESCHKQDLNRYYNFETNEIQMKSIFNGGKINLEIMVGTICKEKWMNWWVWLFYKPIFKLKCCGIYKKELAVVSDGVPQISA